MKTPGLRFLTLVAIVSHLSYGKVQELVCETYNSDCGSPSNASCTSMETCFNERLEQELGCMAVWTNNSETGFKLHMKGCWQYQPEGNPCVKDDECVNDDKINEKHLFCCCTKPMCNNRIVAIPPPAEIETPALSQEAAETPTDSQMIVVLLFMILIAISLIVALLYFAYRKYGQRCYEKAQAKARAAAQNDAMAASLLGIRSNQHIGQRTPVQMIEVVAQGRFGQVWRGTLGNQDIAVKVFPHHDADSWVQEQDIFAIHGMKTCENILLFIAAETRGTGPQTEYWLLTTYHKHGALTDYLKAHVLTLPQALHMIKGILSGLTFLHEELLMNDGTVKKPTIVHRDFKSRNVLLKDDLSACIADFGLALKCEHGRTPQDTHGQVGTRRYMSPEVLEGATEFSAFAFRQIDVYACALVIWEVVTRTKLHDQDEINAFKLPFEDVVGSHPTLNEMQTSVVNNKRRPSIPKKWLDDSTRSVLANTMEEMWDTEPEARITAGCAYERVDMLLKTSQPVLFSNHRNSMLPQHNEHDAYVPAKNNSNSIVDEPSELHTAITIESSPLILNTADPRV